MPAFYLQLPIVFLRFWYILAPASLVAFFESVNRSFFKLMSLSLLFKTFFQPWKNEYREGLVGFSLAMGMVVKTVMICIDIFFFTLLLFVEAVFMIGFLFLPIGTLWLLFLPL